MPNQHDGAVEPRQRHDPADPMDDERNDVLVLVQDRDDQEARERKEQAHADGAYGLIEVEGLRNGRR